MSETQLRDHLAVERTHLANERTLLSYVRTALSLIVGGIVALQLLPPSLSVTLLAWLAMIVGALLVLVGARRFLKVRGEIPRPD